MSNAEVQNMVSHLRVGGLLIYPTETSYAIGCDATDAHAVREIFRLKGRELGKPLPLIVASRAMAEMWAVFTPLARRLTAKYWPGPLTIVLHATRHSEPQRGISHLVMGTRIAPGVAAPDGTIALRVSSHPIARALSRRIGHPIIATSANRSGDPPVFSARAAQQAFPDARGVRIINVGALPRRRPSTIIDCTGVRPRVLRAGVIHLPRTWFS